MCSAFKTVREIREMWVEGSFTNQVGIDFCGSAEFRRNAQMVVLAAGTIAYVPPGDRPSKVIVVSETDMPIEGRTLLGLQFLIQVGAQHFRRGQTYFDRKMVFFEDPPLPVPARMGGCTI